MVDVQSLVERMAKAITSGDAETYSALYSPDAKFWHNTDGILLNVPDLRALMRSMHENYTDINYTARKVHPTPDGYVAETTLYARKRDGTFITLYFCRVTELDEQGLITRVNEYYDPTKTVGPAKES